MYYSCDDESQHQSRHGPESQYSSGNPTQALAPEVTNTNQDGAKPECANEHPGLVAVNQTVAIRDEQRTNKEQQAGSDGNDRHFDVVEPL